MKGRSKWILVFIIMSVITPYFGRSPMNVPSMKQPSAFLPLVMSLTALAMVLGHAAIYGIVHETDEGPAAHIFQILMAAQVPVVAFFAIK